jgi:long-chain fatty acid transport protein
MKLARAAWCVALLVGVMPAVVQAQGFQLNEIGSCAIGRGQAVTGAPCNDASAIYWNPAATTSLSGWSAYGGAAWINVKGSYTADTTNLSTPGAVPPAFPPHIFVNWTAPSHVWAFGLGIYAPYGLTSQWPNGFQGNFVGQKAALAALYVQPNAAWQFSKDWSVGVGLIYGYSQVQLKEALDLSAQVAAPGITFGQLGIPKFTQFGTAVIKGDASGYGFSLGLHGKLGANWQVGARYLSSIKFKYDNGEANFTQVATGLTLAAGNPLGAPAGTPVDALLTPQFLSPGGKLVSQGANTAITMPWQGQVGLGYSGFTNWLLEADFVMSGFDSFNTLAVNFTGPASASSTVLLEEYTTSWTVRFGAEHAFASGVKGRAGFTYVSTPVPDVTVTPLLPDQDRENFMIGAGFPLGATWSLDAAYMFVNTQGRRGRVVDRTSTSETAAELNSGWYQLTANILSVSFKANY